MTDYSIFWTAISAISTSIACIIALFLPIIQYKINNKKSLKFIVDSRIGEIIDIKKEYMLSIYIVNNGNTFIQIENIELIIKDYIYEQKIDSDIIHIFNKNINFPIKLCVGESICYNISLTALEKLIKNEYQFINLNQPIKILVKDSLNKSYTYNTKKSLKEYLTNIS